MPTSQAACHTGTGEGTHAVHPWVAEGAHRVRFGIYGGTAPD